MMGAAGLLMVFSNSADVTLVCEIIMPLFPLLESPLLLSNSMQVPHDYSTGALHSAWREKKSVHPVANVDLLKSKGVKLEI